MTPSRRNPRDPGRALLAAGAALAASGAAAWLIFADRIRLAGVLALVAAAAAAASVALSGRAGGAPRTSMERRAAFADGVADRIVDAALLAPIAWRAFGPEPRVSGAALVLLGAASVTAYLPARGRGLGYRVSDPPWYRGARIGLVGLGLLAARPEPGLWAALALALAAGTARWFEVARQGRSPAA